MRHSAAFEDLLRELAPQVLGALVRRYGHFDVAEDAVQEALLVAAQQWPVDGVPQDPRPWLIRIGSRKMIDLLRNESARRERELTDAARAPVVDVEPVDDQDDSLVLLFLCCHPALTMPSQIALTLRAVGGLTTTEIARALLVPEATLGQRISRAKQAIRKSGVPFGMPPSGEQAERLAAVLQVIYLIFNEGYASTAGPVMTRIELSGEAIRLARMLHAALPDDGEVAGLLALLLLTDARRDARIGQGGMLIPMDEQDRDLWDRAAIDEGVDLITASMSRGSAGPYQLQAAIAAVHDEASTAEETDWLQILALYTLLDQLTDNPVVRLNRAVAVAKVHGPRAGLAAVDAVAADDRVASQHRVDVVRAHLLESAGDLGAAVEHYRAAARAATNIPEQRYLKTRADRIAQSSR